MYITKLLFWNRYAADVFTEGLMLLARSINPSAPTLFHAPLSTHSKSYKPSHSHSPADLIDTLPKKLDWVLSPELRVGIKFAETRLSDLICQNDIQALEFKGYGKNFITSHGFSPDAFVQMAFQAAYFGLYGGHFFNSVFWVVWGLMLTFGWIGRIECTYEPAMTKAFLHGRTEAIRTVQPQSVHFTKVSSYSPIVSTIKHIFPDILLRSASKPKSRSSPQSLREPQQANKRMQSRIRPR